MLYWEAEKINTVGKSYFEFVSILLNNIAKWWQSAAFRQIIFCPVSREYFPPYFVPSSHSIKIQNI